MKRIGIILLTAALAGCGADTMSSAATAAALKKQEAEQGKRTLHQFRRKIDSAAEEMRRSAERTAAAANGD